ncbi:hypothetical protein [Variovorax boronicumulans]|uniref:hypothetical protein n=1 Tax=Variovorax boronicumulans TaxID=436515 RepID=UPI001C58C24F
MSTQLQPVYEAAGANAIVNQNFQAVSPAGVFGMDAFSSSGLGWTYYGGRAFGNEVLPGGVTLAPSVTNYIVADRSTGVVTAATTTTNWNNTAGFMRLYSVVASSDSVFSWADYREAYGAAAAGGGMANPMTAVGDIIVGGTVTSGVAAPSRLGLGTANQVLKVNSGGTALEYGTLAGTGDVVGPASSTDNTLPRFDGTGGKTLQASGVVISDADAMSGYKGSVNRQTGTTYTLQASDTGKIVELANASAITLTLPNDLPIGFTCTLVQDGAGQVAVTAADGASIKNRQSHTKLAGNGAMAGLYVSTNGSGTAAAYRFCGDTST